MELTVKDLRIGNLVKEYYSGDIIKVDINILTLIYKTTQPDSDFQNVYQPIPLTEEWLIKFGFKMKNMNIGTFNDCWHEYELFKYPKTKNITLSLQPFNKKDVAVLARIFYVHQLQNLYFALTQKELEINN